MTKLKDMEAEEDERGKRVIINSSKRACFIECQDADYSQHKIPPLIDEVELMIMARIPLSEYAKLCLLSKRHLSLVKNGELLRIRRQLGIKDPSVFVLSTGDENWWRFDSRFTSQKRLPQLPAESSFILSDKETICAGTHLLVSGIQTNSPVIWRYELSENKWFLGSFMNESRCLFASASCGESAFVAGGLKTSSQNKGLVLSSAEKYNSNTRKWELLPSMKEKRKFCSGIYMDGKFYVLGGQNEFGESLTCGEVFYEEKNIWVKIPGILEDSVMVNSGGSPPLVAVVKNELYSIDTGSNQLKLYVKESNTWKKLGVVPVITEFSRGWGVAFKSLGDELLVMGTAGVGPAAGRGLAVYACAAPDLSSGGELEWRLLNGAGQINWLSHFIRNCCVMS